MESVILLIIIAIIFAVVVIADRGDQSETLGQEKAKPQPFDSKTAIRQPKNFRLQGPAFIIDGDSLVIRKNQIRLFGVDAPEMNHPYGQKAKWALVSLCKGRIVSAEVVDQDAYGRFTAICTLDDGRDLSAEMVKLGLAIDWAKFSGGKYRELEVPDARKKLWLADARQKGRMHVWDNFAARQKSGATNDKFPRL